MAFKQTEKNRSPVKLDKIKRRVSSQGQGFDVQCGKKTEISVVGRLPFPFKQPKEIVSRSVAGVKSMAPKQPVCAVIGRVVRVSRTTETVEVQGFDLVPPLPIFGLPPHYP
ncbi:hypothetical protein ROHU_006671 [Labeo rohita]|uniref:Uncharacterized protein n=1 Tax=Labeo rohita TaxID=84645 RepID=A0A498MPJ5_LABRO|nr:hypothetical protein ROHU_006671 [Labeo rohita]